MTDWLHAWPAFPVHFLRPQWLWALLALPLLFLVWRKNRQHANVWRNAVDVHLLPHLLANDGKRIRGGFVLVALGWVLAAFALAGPSWRQDAQTLWQSKQPLVIALDLSSAINASDVQPSRLLQAREKLRTLLDERAGGDVALVAYAGDAFTVAPLTDDARNLALFLDALDPSVMPVDGQNASRAIVLSAQLLKSAGFGHGEILLLTDHADAAANLAASKAFGNGYRVSALGLGSADGAAYQTTDGRIGQAHLDAVSLRALAAKGGGGYAMLTAGDADLRALGALDPQGARQQAQQGEKQMSWRDDGYWLLPPLMLLAVFAFRRGLLAFALCALLLPLSQPAWAQAALPKGTLWVRADQAQQARIEQGVKAYNRGDYAAAEKVLQGLDLPDANYDLANALAKQGKYEEALAAYDAALKQQPQMPDAQANREIVLQVLKQQQKDKGQRQSKNGGGSSRQQSRQGDGGQSQQSQRQQDSSNDPSRQQGQQGKDAQNDPQPSSPQDSQRQSQQNQRLGDKSQDGQPQDAQSHPQNQQQADQSQRQQMQQALKQQQRQQSQQNAQAQPAQETAEQRERRQASDMWLRRVPDEPGGLLRRKFQIEYARRQKEGK